MTPIIFRKFKEGDIIAIFPTMPGTMDQYTCNSYQHIGQHGTCEPSYLIQNTKLAKPEGYEKLFQELINIGYDDLKVYKRYQYKFLEEVKSELKRLEQIQ